MSFSGLIRTAACLLILASSGDHSSGLWYGHGTTAILLRSSRVLVAGIDSRETYLHFGENAVRTEVQEVCKAMRIGPWFAMAAGLDRGDGYDALAEVAATMRPGDNLDALAGRVEGAVTGPLISLLSRIRDKDPASLEQRFRHQTILQLSLLGVENRIPEVVILEFTESGTGPPVTLSLRKTRCPGDCPRPTTAYFLGAHAEVDQAILRQPQLLWPPSGDKVAALIGMETLRRPDIVGGSVALIGMDRNGGGFVTPGACPPGRLAAP